MNDSPNPLRAVEFGRLDAETDANLLKYFLDTGTASQVQDERAKLVVGRKGAGKTALFRFLSESLPSKVVALDLDEYVWEFHRGFSDAGLPPERSYTASWKLLVYVAGYAAIRDQLDADSTARGDKALEELGLGDDKGRISAIANWLRRVRRVDLPSVGGVIGGGGIELGDPSDAGPLSPTTAAAVQALEIVLAESFQTAPFTVLLDRLDDAWDGSEEMLHLIAGAVRATREIAIRFGDDPVAPVVAFLREDLWERISYNDRNKMSQDIVFLDWSPDQLADVVAERISKSLSVHRDDAWSAVFTTEEMRQRARARTYLLKRTLGRPRDVVAFAIFCRAEALKHGHDRVEASDIYEAERRYSRHVFDEFKDEMDRHLPDFNAVTNSIKALRKRTFQQSDWFAVAKRNGLNQRAASDALDALFEASIVGQLATGGAEGGSGTVYRYADRHLKPTEDGTLQVHLALVKELGLTDA